MNCQNHKPREEFAAAHTRSGPILGQWTGCDAAGLRMRCGNRFPQFETDTAGPVPIEEKTGVESTEGPDANHVEEAFLEWVCLEIFSDRIPCGEQFTTAHGSFWTNSASELAAGWGDSGSSAVPLRECRGGGNESIALIPVRSGDQTLGFLQFMSRRPDSFNQEDIAFLERLADGFAIALAKMQAEEEGLRLAAAVEAGSRKLHPRRRG